ncbi:MAG: hypothetical protein IT330_01965 [Anaerolineae bacterium]|nr:hypothetical protein [Anaerolineae bacterium]
MRIDPINTPITYPPPTPMPALASWAQTLQGIAARPLQHCEAFLFVLMKGSWYYLEMENPVESA